jgi:hypothetical protein
LIPLYWLLYFAGLSYEVMHRLLGATLLKSEMEIHYLNEHWKKTDYVCSILGKKIAVSVTRAVGFPRVNDFDVEQAVVLLKKKLLGLVCSSFFSLWL